MVKVQKRWRLGDTPVSLRLRYECPLEEVGRFYEPPARLLLRCARAAPPRGCARVCIRCCMMGCSVCWKDVADLQMDFVMMSNVKWHVLNRGTT
jgi:hypothetical protein